MGGASRVSLRRFSDHGSSNVPPKWWLGGRCGDDKPGSVKKVRQANRLQPGISSASSWHRGHKLRFSRTLCRCCAHSDASRLLVLIL